MQPGWDLASVDKVVVIARMSLSGTVELVDPARRMLEAGGKRLRPLLTIAAAVASDPTVAVKPLDPRVRRGAASVELVHVGSLVHDDIMDEALYRHQVSLLAYSPLGFGLLTGKYRRGIPEGSRGALENMAFLRDGLTDPAKNAALKAAIRGAKKVSIPETYVKRVLDYAKQGYTSIGDTHSTRPLQPGMREEETRFFGLRRECGLHYDELPRSA